MLEEHHNAVTADEPMTEAAERRQRRVRAVQIALGCLWILDAALQFQPRMFGSDLVNDMMLPMAHGQPAPVAWSITNLAHFIRPDAGVWNFFFGALQLVHRCGHALPPHGEAGHRRHGGLGLRRLVVRRGVRHAAHRCGVPADRCPGRGRAVPVDRALGVADGARRQRRRRAGHCVLRRRDGATGLRRAALRVVGLLGDLRRALALPGQPRPRARSVRRSVRQRPAASLRGTRTSRRRSPMLSRTAAQRWRGCWRACPW